MLEYERIDANKSPDKSKECDLCHHWYNIDKNFNYQPYLCNGSHDIIIKPVRFNVVAVVSVKGNTYRNHFCFMSKNDAINLLNNLLKMLNITK